MIVKCNCNNCPAQLEFDSANAGQVITCPMCGMETTLYVSVPPSAPKVGILVPATPPPQKFTAPGVVYQQKSSMKFLPWIVVAALVVVSGFLAASFSHEHAQRILLESQLAAAEGKLQTLQANAADANRATVAAEMKQQLAEDQQAVRDAVAGIYEFEPPNQGKTKVLDFRSDGSVVSYYYYGDHSNEPMSKKTLTWTSSKNSISVAAAFAGDAGMSFRPEGDDLIDEKGNRWIRTH